MKNYRKEPVKIIALTILMLFALSFLPEDINFFGIEIKHVDILSDLKNSDYDDENYEEDSTFTKDSLYEEDSSGIDSEVTEASVIAGLGNLGDALLNEFSSNKYSSKIQFKKVRIEDFGSSLDKFKKALKNSSKEKVRIAHFGDSAIEGDNITSELRKEMQKTYGGKGVGFLAITSHDIKFRPTTRHTFSENWETATIYTRNPKNYPVGIKGEVFIPKGKSWVEYYLPGTYFSIKSFSTARVFYTDAKSKSFEYEYKGKTKKAVLEKGKGLHENIINLKRSINQIKFNFDKESAKYFGISLEGKNGVLVDNFPLRGNTGVSILQIPDNILKEFAKKLNYKLFVLQFGLNIANKTDFTWYENEMVKVVNKIKKAFPDAGILIVSVSDKSVKRGSRFVTNPHIPKLIKAQRNVAKRTKVAFWNFFEAMGGRNSMAKWVKASPKLATSDYTHFTLNGSKKAGKMLAEAILDFVK